MQEPSAAAVKTIGLGRRFGDLVAVDHLDLEIPRGELFGLLGPNGAGKTTTLRILTTLLPAGEGSARVAGFDVTRESANVRAHIGYVPQALSAEGALTGRENVSIFACLQGLRGTARRVATDDALRAVGLADAGDRLARTFSGGMIRRLEIAQALVHRPDVLLLDEPTVGLDPVARTGVWDALERLRVEQGTTILLTTHYMEEADHLCDRVGIMHRGRIAALGTPEELKAGIGRPDATLEDVFRHVTGGSLEAGAAYAQTKQLRKTAGRLG